MVKVSPIGSKRSSGGGAPAADGARSATSPPPPAGGPAAAAPRAAGAKPSAGGAASASVTATAGGAASLPMTKTGSSTILAVGHPGTGAAAVPGLSAAGPHPPAAAVAAVKAANTLAPKPPLARPPSSQTHPLPPPPASGSRIASAGKTDSADGALAAAPPPRPASSSVRVAATAAVDPPTFAATKPAATSPPPPPAATPTAANPAAAAAAPAAAFQAVVARVIKRLGPAGPAPVSTAHVPGALPFAYAGTELHAAVAAGDMERLGRALEKGDIDLELLDPSGATALVLAVNARAIPAVEALLAAGAQRHYRLHWAAQHGRAKLVSELLGFGAPPDLEDEFGVTPLEKAAMGGHTGTVEVLLRAGAAVDRAVEGDRTTPLLLAAAGGFTDTVRRLLAAGATVADRDAEGRSPLVLAGLCGAADLISLLLEAGDEVNSVDAAGNTALHAAAANGHPAALQVLLAASAKIDWRNAAGETALVAALNARHKAAEAVLAAAGANPHFRLHWAAQGGEVQVVKELLLGQAPVDLQDGLGWTALNVAARHGQQGVVGAGGGGEVGGGELAADQMADRLKSGDMSGLGPSGASQLSASVQRCWKGEGGWNVVLGVTTAQRAEFRLRAKEVREASGVVVAPYLTALGRALRKKRQPVFARLRTK
ncbi:hypothetical protein HYH03_016094, partial [Edaphochlamys debaryana]